MKRPKRCIISLGEMFQSGSFSKPECALPRWCNKSGRKPTQRAKGIVTQSREGSASSLKHQQKNSPLLLLLLLRSANMHTARSISLTRLPRRRRSLLYGKKNPLHNKHQRERVSLFAVGAFGPSDGMLEEVRLGTLPHWRVVGRNGKAEGGGVKSVL